MKVIRPDFTSLKIFLSVYATGNIARAAEREHIAPSAISKRLQDLESDAGVPLFHRHARGVTATPAGEALARHAAKVLDSLSDMAAELSGFLEGVRGDVRIHAHSSAMIQYLPEEIADFARSWPEVRVVLREQISPEVIGSLNEGTADIGIFAGNMGPQPNLTLIPYRRDRLVVLLPRDHRLAGAAEIGFSALRDVEFISPESGSSLQLLMEQAAQDLGFALRLRIEVKTFEATIRMADEGLGIAVIPQGVAAQFARQTRLVPVKLSDSWAYRNLVLAIRSEQKLAPAARLMLRHLRAAAERAAQPGRQRGDQPARRAMAVVPNG